MKFVVFTLCALLLVLFAAGCVDTDIPEPQIPVPTPTPAITLTGDPVLGVWNANNYTFTTDPVTDLSTEISTNYTITVREDATATIDATHYELVGFSVSLNTYTMDGDVLKNENIYTITADLLGTYVITFVDENQVTLTTPEGLELPLVKQ